MFVFQHDPTFSPRWRNDPVNEAQPLSESSLTDNLNGSPSVSTPKSNKVVDPKFNISPIAKINFEFDEETAKSGSYSQTKSSASATISTGKSSYGDSVNLRVQSTSVLPPVAPLNYKVAGKLANTERFYFPAGKPVSKAENDVVLQKIQMLFNSRPDMPASGFDEIARRMGLPVYSKRAIFEACCQCSAQIITDSTLIKFQDFVSYWNR